MPPSPPSSPKAVSATVLTSSHKGRLICARGTSPLARFCYRSSVEERWFGSAIVIRSGARSALRAFALPPRFCALAQGGGSLPCPRRSGAGWRVPPPACPLADGAIITFAAENALHRFVSPPSSSCCSGLNSAFGRCAVGSRLSRAPLRGLWGPRPPQAPCKGASPPTGGQRSPLRAAFLFGRALGSSGCALFPSRSAPLGGFPSVAPVWRIAPPRRLLRRRRSALPSAPLRSAWALSKLRPRFPSGRKKPPKGTTFFGSAQIAISGEYSKASNPLVRTFAFRPISNPIAHYLGSGGCRPPSPPPTPTHHPMAVIFSEMQLNIVKQKFTVRNFFFNTSVNIR